MDDRHVVFRLPLPELLELGRKRILLQLSCQSLRITHSADSRRRQRLTRQGLCPQDAAQLVEKRFLSGCDDAPLLTCRQELPLHFPRKEAALLAHVIHIVDIGCLRARFARKRQSRIGERHGRKKQILLCLELADEMREVIDRLFLAIRTLHARHAIGAVRFEHHFAARRSRTQSGTRPQQPLREGSDHLDEFFIRRSLRKQHESVTTADVADAALLLHLRPIGRFHLAPRHIIDFTLAETLAQDMKQLARKGAFHQERRPDIRLEAVAREDILLNRARIKKNRLQFDCHPSFLLASFSNFRRIYLIRF